LKIDVENDLERVVVASLTSEGTVQVGRSRREREWRGPRALSDGRGYVGVLGDGVVS